MFVIFWGFFEVREITTSSSSCFKARKWLEHKDFQYFYQICIWWRVCHESFVMDTRSNEINVFENHIFRFFYFIHTLPVRKGYLLLASSLLHLKLCSFQGGLYELPSLSDTQSQWQGRHLEVFFFWPYSKFCPELGSLQTSCRSSVRQCAFCYFHLYSSFSWICWQQRNSWR